jgi:hypothetical protein
MVAAVSQSAEPDGDLFTDFSRYPGSIEFRVVVPEYATRDREFLYFPLPASLQNLLNLRADERANPLLLSRNHRRSVAVEMALPAGFVADYLPTALDARDVAGAGIRVSISTREAGTPAEPKLTYGADADIPCDVVAAQRYAELLNLDKSLSHRRSTIVLLRTGPAPAGP